MIISLIATLTKRLGAVCLSFVILWHVTHHAGPRGSRAIVHVTQPDVTVEVDEQRYHVGSIMESPLVFELEPGRHVAEVWRDGELLGGESFTVEAGEEVVVSPDARQVGVAAGSQVSQPAQQANRAGLAVESPQPKPDAAGE
jgi:hypothetical protein